MENETEIAAETGLQYGIFDTDSMVTMSALGDPADDFTLNYFNTIETFAPGTSALVDGAQVPGEQWYDTLLRLMPQIAATWQQKELLELQMQRARQGLPPLNVSQYAPGINVGVTDDTKQLLIYGGIALAGVFLLTQFAGKRGKR